MPARTPSSPSRRSFLKGSAAAAAVAGGLPLPVSSGGATPDARLVELQQRLAAIDDELAKTDGELDVVERRVSRECPPPPELAAFVQDIDQTFDPVADAEALARLARRRWRATPSTRPRGLSQAQRALLLARYVAAVKAAGTRLGYGALKRRMQVLDDEQEALRREFLTTPAETVAGIVAKLRIVDQSFAWSLDRRPDEDYHACLMLRTLRDAERMAAGD